MIRRASRGQWVVTARGRYVVLTRVSGSEPWEVEASRGQRTMLTYHPTLRSALRRIWRATQ